MAGDLAAVEAESAAFNGTLIWSFVLLGLGLVVGGLPAGARRPAAAAPCEGMRWPASATAARSAWKATSPPRSRRWPPNSIRLIEHSDEVVGRARTHVSNLAHFLKTPLSVLASEAEARSPAPWPIRCAARSTRCAARSIIIWRARAPPAASMCWATAPQVAPVLDDLARVLARIHAERAIAIDCDCPPDLFFRGERQDLEEMAGNLMDNACKWARAQGAGAGRARKAPVWILTVEDDGPGLTPEERSRVGNGAKDWTKAYPAPGWAWPSCAIFPSFMGVLWPWRPRPWAALKCA